MYDIYISHVGKVILLQKLKNTQVTISFVNN
jgi:hypothetical protein